MPQRFDFLKDLIIMITVVGLLPLFFFLPYQFTAGSPQEAKEWVDQIKIVLRGKREFLLCCP